MKTKIKAIACLILLLLVASVTLSACWSLYYLSYHPDDYSCYYSYSFVYHDAYCEYVSLTRGETNFVILDEINGIPVTGLGKNTDITSDFHVLVHTDTPEGAHSWTWRKDEYPQPDENTIVIDGRCQTVVVNLHLGANISNIRTNERWYHGYYITENHHEFTDVVLVKVVFNVTVSEKNATFFAEDGKLYYKDSGELFEGFLYE